ncbi:MAG: hypothetical protein ACHP84_01750 [Caulobacterales bacterium]
MTSNTTLGLAFNPDHDVWTQVAAGHQDGASIYSRTMTYEDFISTREPSSLFAPIPRAEPCVITVANSGAEGVFAFVGRGMLEDARIRAYDCVQTAAPRALCIVVDQGSLSAPIASIVDPPAIAARLLDQIQDWAGLTLEQLAPLVGVSRRSLQNWRAGEPISGRKADRLRAVSEAIEALGAKGSARAQTRLFERRPFGVSLYDLLREGRFDAVWARMHGDRPATALPQERDVLHFDAPINRIDLHEDGVMASAGSVRPRRTRRPKLQE